MNRTVTPLRRARRRTHQRQYRRAWIERHCNLDYERVRKIVRASGAQMRTLTDRELATLVRAVVEQQRSAAVERELMLQTLVTAVQRSERWVRAALRRLGLRVEDLPIEPLLEERYRREQLRRERIRAQRANRAA